MHISDYKQNTVRAFTEWKKLSFLYSSSFSGLTVHYCTHHDMCYCWRQKKHHKHKCWEHKTNAQNEQLWVSYFSFRSYCWCEAQYFVSV